MLPDAKDPFEAGLGGTEQALIHLTTALAERGHDVTVLGGSPSSRRLQGVDWLEGGAPREADIAVAVNDASLLGRVRARLPVLWFHNEVEIFRELRKRRMPALLRHRPAAVFIGSEQARLASWLLPLRARATIPYGLSERILAAPSHEAVPAPVAIFTSQAYRGLKQLIALWQRRIAQAAPQAKLHAYIAERDLPEFRALAANCPSISVQGRIANDAVLDTLRRSRVLLAPGHRSETFCLAAAEAIAMGVPVVTLGIGSLKERVRHDKDGFVCRDWTDFASFTASLLTDDSLWHRLHEAGLRTRENADWGRVAKKWEDFAQPQL